MGPARNETSHAVVNYVARVNSVVDLDGIEPTTSAGDPWAKHVRNNEVDWEELSGGAKQRLPNRA